jgi:hypothetical protein
MALLAATVPQGRIRDKRLVANRTEALSRKREEQAPRYSFDSTSGSRSSRPEPRFLAVLGGFGHLPAVSWRPVKA